MVEVAPLESGATQRLKDSEASFRALVDAVQGYAIYRLDREGRVSTWNKGAERVKGYTAAEILGQNFARFYPEEDVVSGKPARQLREAARLGRVEDQGWRVRKDGSRFWANAVITPLRDENGVLKGFAKVTQDVTERKQAEDSLRQREQVLDAFFSASSVGMAILDRELRYQRVNETLAAINGVPARKHLGKTVREVIPGLADEVESRMKQVLDSGTAILNEEFSGPMPTQPEATGFWTANYFALRDETGNVTQLGMVIVDITRRRAAEDSLRRLSGRLMDLQDQERRRIARELHDSVGQALTAIKLNLELAMQGLNGGQIPLATRQALAECQELASQCATDTRTISYLLHPPLLDERGLSSAVQWYVDGFARRSGIDVHLDLPEAEMRLSQAFETTLFRVLQEALTNIHRHSGSPAASIRLVLGAQEVRLEIRDQGRGMPASSLNSFKDSARMLGVGIAGMRERVRQLGGRLDVESSDQGTAITATLPTGGQS